MRAGVVIAMVFVLCAAADAAASPIRVAVPGSWGRTLQVGVSDSPGGAAEAVSRGRVSQRYQYLTGGVDTGKGWAAWDPGGTFVSTYVRESAQAGLTSVLTYYQLLHSKGRPGVAELSEGGKALANLDDDGLMRRYYADLRLALTRASEGGRTVVLHVEPDLWGFAQQRHGDDARTVPAAVASTGDAELAGLPDTLAGFARAIVRLRDRRAPKVLLAWHLSTWGTNRSTTADDPSRAQLDALAARSAAFAHSLGARFDLIFNDVADRDDGFRERVLRQSGSGHRWGRGDAARHLRWVRGVTRRTHTPMVLWQLPVGNRRLANTWKRFRDNRVDLLLGSRRNLRRARDAGVVGLLFGAGTDGCTTARSDGGHFFRLARRYARAPLRLRQLP